MSASTLSGSSSSGKPTLLYAAPLPDGVRYDAELTSFMKNWASLTAHLVEECGGANIRLHAETWRGVPGEIVHRDIVHLKYGEGVVQAVDQFLEQDLDIKIDRRENIQIYDRKKTREAKGDGRG